MEAASIQFLQIFFFRCQLPFAFSLKSVLVIPLPDSFKLIRLRLKRKCLCSIKLQQKSEQRMRDASGSEQHKTEAIPYDSFDLLRNFFIVEVGEQQVSFAVAQQKNLLISEPCFKKVNFSPSRVVWAHAISCHSREMNDNFPLFRLPQI